MSVKSRIFSLALLVSAPIAYALTGPSPITYVLTGIEIGVYGTVIYMVISMIRKMKQMKKVMGIFKDLGAKTEPEYID